MTDIVFNHMVRASNIIFSPNSDVPEHLRPIGAALRVALAHTLLHAPLFDPSTVRAAKIQLEPELWEPYDWLDQDGIRLTATGHEWASNIVAAAALTQ